MVIETVGRLLFPKTGRCKFPVVDAISGWGYDPNQVVINGKD
jgi:hypothetical protein